MLEVKDLVKVYKTKGGATVRALDGVSLSFEESGMVFILGKSGSGKSTLLNICGGLDAPDSGEIIIKGRSSRDFSPSDFDSYRNTFVGFVFQEYNILNEFTVEENIAIALELQGKNKDRARVQEILEQVDLASLGKRKPNTLSGGQKQRVAIARALVKNPEIIMADEPTGALDSATGRQVFDTIKKLSRDKLVIVVSHDRELAEQYGDRIIELKDGKVISDVTKTKVSGTAASDNLTFIGGDTITVRSGAQLTQGDLNKINEFIKSSNGDLIISCGERQVDDFKRVAKIDDSGAMEIFRATTEDDIERKQYAPEESKFIRSHMPMRHAVKMGASSLKVKPFRLFFTILLSFIAFTMFGLVSTLTFYDPVETAYRTYAASDITSLRLRKNYSYTYESYNSGGQLYSYDSSNSANFTEDDLNEMRQDYGGKALGAFNYAGGNRSYTIMNVGPTSGEYYRAEVSEFATFDRDSWADDILAGSTELGDDDVIISSYIFNAIKEGGLTTPEGEEVIVESYDDIVGKTLIVGDAELTVAGVYKNDLPDKYDPLLDNGEAVTAEEIIQLRQQISSELNDGSYRVMLVSDGFYKAHKAQFKDTDYSGPGYDTTDLNMPLVCSENEQTKYDLSANEIYKYPAGGPGPQNVSFLDGRTDGVLKYGEIMLPLRAIEYKLDELFRNMYANAHDTAQTDELYNKISNAFYTAAYGQYYYEDIGQTAATDEQIEEALVILNDFLNEYAPDGWYDASFWFDGTMQKAGDYEIAAYYYGADEYNYIFYFSPADYDKLCAVADENGGTATYVTKTNYTFPADAIYSAIYLPMPENSALHALLEGENVRGGDDTYYLLNTGISSDLNSVNGVIDVLSSVFLWIGVVMAVFSMLLLFNFISVSISCKKKEIGILRAVGAKSSDVFKIFFSESAIITLICYALAMIASFAGCILLNNVVAYDIGVTIFVFGPLSWLVMLAIAVVTSFISTFLPVYAIAKRRPVESIRAL